MAMFVEKARHGLACLACGQPALYLASKPGVVVSKTELTEHLYEQDHERDSNTIEVFVGRLRRKLDPDQTRQPIQTVRGAGYRFTLLPAGD